MSATTQRWQCKNGHTFDTRAMEIEQGHYEQTYHCPTCKTEDFQETAY